MSVGQAVVDEARRWLGTPYRHQASVRGAGTDCLGLVRGIWRELYGGEPQDVPTYSADWVEPKGQERLWQAALQHLRPAGSLGVGQVLLFRMREGSSAKHLGICAESANYPTFIHAYSGHQVCESGLSEPWARRVVARFAFPEGQ